MPRSCQTCKVVPPPPPHPPPLAALQALGFLGLQSHSTTSFLAVMIPLPYAGSLHLH